MIINRVSAELFLIVVLFSWQIVLSEARITGTHQLSRASAEWKDFEKRVMSEIPKQVLEMHEANLKHIPEGMDTTDFPLMFEGAGRIERSSAKPLIVVMLSDLLGGKLVVYEEKEPKNFTPIWVSEETLHDRMGGIEIEDVNKDGKPEILAHASAGAHGSALYLYTWEDSIAHLLRPNGDTSRTNFAGDGSGVSNQDLDGDSIQEISCYNRDYDWKYHYLVDHYKWDGKNYVFWKQGIGGLIEKKY